MNRLRAAASVLFALALLLAGAAPGAAALADSLGASAPRPRASWLKDGVELVPGDLVTVIIDEQTIARESSSEVGVNKRSLGANLSATTDGTSAMGATGVDSKWDSQSSQNGQANRSGGLSGVLTARVVSIEPGGAARIEGSKTLTVDGRKQEIHLTGLVRPQDLSSDHVIHSSRVADAAIDYKGKKIAPKMGIIGKVVSMIWPF